MITSGSDAAPHLNVGCCNPNHPWVCKLSFNLIIGDPTIGCELLYIENDDNEIAKQKKDKRPKRTALMKAMNDVANHLVDKAVITE